MNKIYLVKPVLDALAKIAAAGHGAAVTDAGGGNSHTCTDITIRIAAGDSRSYTHEFVVRHTSSYSMQFSDFRLIGENWGNLQGREIKFADALICAGNLVAKSMEAAIG